VTNSRHYRFFATWLVDFGYRCRNHAHTASSSPFTSRLAKSLASSSSLSKEGLDGSLLDAEVSAAQAYNQLTL
jgi:hypothetical protein